MRARSARLAIALTSAVAITAIAVPWASGEEAAPDRLSAVTTVGVHNAYEQGTFPYFADALDSGATLLELDVWTDPFTRRWRVSHSNMFGNANNCANTADPAQLRTAGRNQDLGRCLDNIKAWHDTHAGHAPIVLKIEVKDGFQGNQGQGPADFDELVNSRLGDAVYGPGDLLAKPGGGTYATLDEAAVADNWATHEALAGKVLIELIPGTFEQGNPFDTLWTDVEYAHHLRDLHAAGNAGRAAAFPAVLGAASGDPRTRYGDTGLRPWFVVFDGSATSYVGGGIDAGWYARQNYLLVMTGAHSVAPEIDSRNPTEQQALDRINQLASEHASILTSDWAASTGVLDTVVPRTEG